MNEQLAQWVNCLGRFCGKRDVPSLTREALLAGCGTRQADVMMLFGGSILCGGDVLAEAMRQGAAKTYVLVGGAGHTTGALRAVVHLDIPDEVRRAFQSLKREFGGLVRAANPLFATR